MRIRMSGTFTVCAVGLALYLAAAAAAEGTSPTVAGQATTSPSTESDPAAVEWLRKIEELHKPHSRASGTFRQIRKDPIFLEEIRATGRFYYERPDRFRSDYNPPEESTTWVIGNEVTLYFPDLRQVEKYRMSREGSGVGEMNQMLLAFGIETTTVLKHFTVSTTPSKQADLVRLVFVPKGPRRERPFQRFELALTKSILAPKPGEETFRIVGAEGDVTSIEITGINWNPPADAEWKTKFQLKFPRNVEIIDEDYSIEGR